VRRGKHAAARRRRRVILSCRRVDFAYFEAEVRTHTRSIAWGGDSRKASRTLYTVRFSRRGALLPPGRARDRSGIRERSGRIRADSPVLAAERPKCAQTVISCQLPVVSCQLSVVSCQLPVDRKQPRNRLSWPPESGKGALPNYRASMKTGRVAGRWTGGIGI
jgi:hypothetical protein